MQLVNKKTRVKLKIHYEISVLAKNSIRNNDVKNSGSKTRKILLIIPWRHPINNLS